MRRRDFITFLSGATAWAAVAHAQEPRRVIGVLSSMSYGTFPGSEAAFMQGLKASGFLEGKNVHIEWRWAEGQYDRLASLVGELVSRDVAVLVTLDAPAALAAKEATKTTPIVFATGTDPVGIGLVQSFNRPSGNLTGTYSLVADVGPKHLDLMHELLPAASMIVSLLNPRNPNAHDYALHTQAAADALGLRLQALTAHSEADLEAAIGIHGPTTGRCTARDRGPVLYHSA